VPLTPCVYVRTAWILDVRSSGCLDSRMALTASKLRENIYKILDQVLATGVPAEISRAGRRLRIVPVEDPPSRRLDRLQPQPDALVGDPEDLVHLDWSGEWKP
jgi:hypothetical protein